jgi:hypothetical protein
VCPAAVFPSVDNFLSAEIFDRIGQRFRAVLPAPMMFGRDK